MAGFLLILGIACIIGGIILAVYQKKHPLVYVREGISQEKRRPDYIVQAENARVTVAERGNSEQERKTVPLHTDSSASEERKTKPLGRETKPLKRETKPLGRKTRPLNRED